MKNYFALFTTALALLFAPLAVAADEPKLGTYVGIGAGQATLKDYCSDARALAADADLTLSSCEDSELFFRFFLGYQVNEFFAAELGSGFASGYKTVLSTGSASASIEADYFTLALGVQAQYPIGRLSVLGRAGMHAWELDVSGSAPGETVTASTDGTDPYFGVGVEFEMTENFVLAADYTRYAGDDDDMDTYGVSIKARF